MSQYDAAYLALAESEDALLLTADGAMLAAAGVRGVAVGNRDQQVSEAPATYGGTPTWAHDRETAALLGKLRAGAERAARVRL